VPCYAVAAGQQHVALRPRTAHWRPELRPGCKPLRTELVVVERCWPAARKQESECGEKGSPRRGRENKQLWHRQAFAFGKRADVFWGVKSPASCN